MVDAGDFVLEVRSSLGNAVYSVDLGATGGSAQTVEFDTDFGGNSVTYSGTGTDAEIVFNTGGIALSAEDVGKTAVVQITAERAAIADDNALTFQVGANEGQYIRVGIQDMGAAALRLEGLDLVGADDDESRLRAQNAIGVVDQALDYVNATRSRIGAYQNRIEYRLNTLQVARENLTASESRIRDADIAAETANLTRAQILVQAGTAVLTQANITPQSALNLL